MHGRLHRYLLRLFVPLLVVLIVPAVLAQEERTLTSGASVTGVLDSDNVAQVYTFAGAAGDSVTLTASSATGLGLALLLADSTGAVVAQGFESSGPTTLADVVLPAVDTYYVTVLSALGVTLPAGNTFDLTFELVEAAPDGESTEEATETVDTATPEATSVPETPAATTTTFAPGQILTVNGMQISLVWNSLANLDLEVRDPVGGSVYFSTPNAPSGGEFGVNVNSVCDTRTADSPTEQVAWPAGSLPTGSYELLVYYQPLTDCPTTDPVSFTVNVRLDGQQLEPIEGNLLPNEVFLSSVVVGPDASLTQGASGLYTDTTVLPVPLNQLRANPQPITRDVPVADLLTSQNFYDVYTFQGQANELISITMNATSGSLDTLLLLLDSAGNIIGSNDDEAQGVTDSAILNFRLFANDTYTIVATRYGKDVGGTEGNYTLLLTGPTGDLPSEILDLGLPRGSVEIAVSWNTNADLQLLVRDPRGDSVFDDTPQVPSGGRLAAAGNVNCIISQTSPVSYIYWPEGLLAPGLYEVEVWYQNTCNDTRSVSFALNILVNGNPVFTQTAQPTPNEIFLTSFVIGVDGQVQTSEGGFIGTRQMGGVQRLDSSTLDFRSDLPNALPITSGQTLSNSITNDDKFDLYTFEGEAGDVVTISMVATAGRLDTVLFLLDPNGFQIADNDDAVVGESTDSLISEFVLPQDGTYTIIATHFGMQYGGTTGAYDISFSRLN
jgi:hypothetical protein